MREIIADLDDDTPIIRLQCPDCRSPIDRAYSVRHGEHVQCDECGVPILVTFNVEAIPE